MRCSIWCVATLILVSVPVSAQVEIVQQAKADLVAKGVDLSGACGAVKITNLVAWRLRAQGYGLLHKAGGFRAILKADGTCLSGEQTSDPEGYANDYIIQGGTGVGFDLLSDGGGANGPQWNGPENGPDIIERNFANFRAPLDPSAYLGGTPIPPSPLPVPVPPPQPPPVDSQVFSELIIHRAILADLQSRAADTQNRLATVTRQLDEHRMEDKADHAQIKADTSATESKLMRASKLLGEFVLPGVSSFLASKFGANKDVPTSTMVAATTGASVIAMVEALSRRSVTP